jgi:hypothetical protein
VTDLAIRHNVVGPHQIKIVDFVAGNELVDVDRARGLQRDVVEFVLADLEIGVGVDFVAFDDIFVSDFLAGVGINLLILDPMARLFIDLVEADFSDSEVAGNNAIGHVTSDSRRKPFQLARGAMYSNSTCTEFSSI